MSDSPDWDEAGSKLEDFMLTHTAAMEELFPEGLEGFRPAADREAGERLAAERRLEGG